MSTTYHATRAVAIAAAFVVISIGAAPTPAQAQQQSTLSQVLAEFGKALEAEQQDAAIKRVFNDVLNREADYNGLVNYRNQIMHHGWDEHDVRAALQKSPEYRQKNAMTRDKAVEIVRRAYLSVLHREPDAPGMEGFVQGVMKQHWTEAEIARELRNSDEYRSKHR